jgi:hypothetical protein
VTVLAVLCGIAVTVLLLIALYKYSQDNGYGD